MKIFAVMFISLSALAAADAGAHWSFPPPPPPEEYGNITIDRTSGSSRNDLKPVTFSHWMHRRNFTCRVCHFELEFQMKAGKTEITEKANRDGKYCGACHDGTLAFGHTPVNCEKCHNGEIGSGNSGFFQMWRFPKTRYGNQIDWCLALEENWIKPVRYLSVPPMPDNVIGKKVEMDSAWSGISSSVFPHRKHTNWLDCNDCHPEPFRMRERQSGISMSQVLSREFCGQCHGSIAFPLTDCARCHPGMRSVPRYQEPASK